MGGGQGWGMLSFTSRWHNQMEIPNSRGWGNGGLISEVKSRLEIRGQNPAQTGKSRNKERIHRDRGEQSTEPRDVVYGHLLFLAVQNPFHPVTALWSAFGKPPLLTLSPCGSGGTNSNLGSKGDYVAQPGQWEYCILLATGIGLGTYTWSKTGQWEWHWKLLQGLLGPRDFCSADGAKLMEINLDLPVATTDSLAKNTPENKAMQRKAE